MVWGDNTQMLGTQGLGDATVTRPGQIGQDVAILQWKARHDPSMWKLLKRAAVAAAQATSTDSNNEMMVEALAEDIIRRADTDPAVYSLLQQAAKAAKPTPPMGTGGSTPSPAPMFPPQQQQQHHHHQQQQQQQQIHMHMPPPMQAQPHRDDSPNDTLPEDPVPRVLPTAQNDMEQVLAEALGLTDMKQEDDLPSIPPHAQQQQPQQQQQQHQDQEHQPPAQKDSLDRYISNVYAGMQLDGLSVMSSDTEGPMPIIPIVSSPHRRRKTPGPQAAGDAPAAAGGGVQEEVDRSGSPLAEVSALSQARMSSEDFAERLKSVLDRYRQRVAEKALQDNQQQRQQAPSSQQQQQQTQEAPPAPRALPPAVTHFTTADSRMVLLKAAYEGGALDAQAFALAVASLHSATAPRPTPEPAAAAAPPPPPPPAAARPPVSHATAVPPAAEVAPPAGVVSPRLHRIPSPFAVPAPAAPLAAYPVPPVSPSVLRHPVSIPEPVPVPVHAPMVDRPSTKDSKLLSPMPQSKPSGSHQAPRQTPPPQLPAARNPSPKPRMVSPMRPAVQGLRQPPVAVPIPQQLPTSAGPVGAHVTAATKAHAERVVEASLRSHSTRMLTAKRNQADCKTPMDPGAAVPVWKPGSTDPMKSPHRISSDMASL